MRTTWNDRWARAAGNGGVVWLVVAVMVVIAVLYAKNFATLGNVNNVSRQGAILAIVGLAQFLVVLLGHVDLAIAANAKLAAILAALVMNGSDGNLLPGIAAALGVGLAVGVLNTVVVVLLKVESFIATLGTAAIVQGTALFVAPTPVGMSAPALTAFYGAQTLGGVYVIVIAVVLVWVAAWFLLTKTVWGRHVFGTGGNREVAAMSGINVNLIQASGFLVSGLLGGVAGLLFLAGAGVGDPNAANGLEFTALAVVVLGGASLAGGRGRLLGLLGGVVLFALLGNVFNLLRIEVWYQQLFRGLIILVAAALFVQGVSRVRRIRHRPGPPASASPTTALPS
jgi:ribose transport system permease protein